MGWSLVGGGGGASGETGEFTVAGSSVGQLGGGESTASESGEFAISSGHWAFLFALPDLNLTMSLDGITVTLTWDAGGPPVVLERSFDMHQWSPVSPQPTEPIFQEPEDGLRAFYRLRLP